MTNPFLLIELKIMNYGTKNKILTWLVVMLLVANAATISMFWLNRRKEMAPLKGTPKEFMIRELKLDQKQQNQLEQLVQQHQESAEQLRKQVRESKEAFFDLLNVPNIADSSIQTAAKAVSVNTEQLDLMTFDHFQKVRAICTPAQQKIFDHIIKQVIAMMGRPGPPPHRPDAERPGD